MIRNEANREPYRTFVETAVAVQEQNVRFALGMFGAQQEAVQALTEGAFEVYFGLLHDQDPKKEASTADRGVPELPIDGYDRLGIEELGRKLEGLCVRDVEKLKDHERRTRNRHTMMERLDRALV